MYPSSAPLNATDNVDVVYWALNGYGVTVLYLVINCVVILLGISIVVLNALVIDTLIRFKKHPEPADVMVCSLALADLCTGLFLFYHTSYNLANYQIYRECLIRFGILVGLVITSILHLAFLSLDRYVKIITPYRYNQVCRIPTVCGLSVVLWVSAILVAFAPAMGWNRDQSEKPSLSKEAENTPVCSFFGLMHPGYLSFMVILFWIPFLVMGLLYLHIFKVAHRHARVIAAQETAHSAPRFRDRHSWRYTKTVVLVMGVYFICWVPVGIVLMMYVMGNLRHLTFVKQGTILLYASTTAYVNSLINPIIYAFKIGVVRNRFRMIFCCKRRPDMDFETTYRGRATVAPVTIRSMQDLSTANGISKVDVT